MSLSDFALYVVLPGTLGGVVGSLTANWLADNWRQLWRMIRGRS
jgi:hypothetical protein